jgi:hypothetical protein
VRIFFNGQTELRVVRSGSSYLSQSELPVTFGVGKQDVIDRAVVEWPSGQNQEHLMLKTGRAYQIIENKGIKEIFQF